MFRRFYTHPLALGLAVVTTLLVLLGVIRLGGVDGAIAILDRSSDHIAQQVVIVGHRVAQQIEIIGKKLRER